MADGGEALHDLMCLHGPHTRRGLKLTELTDTAEDS